MRRTRGNSKDEIRVALRTFASAAFAGAAAVVVAFPAFAALPFALAALAGHVYTFWSHLDGGGIRGGGGRGGRGVLAKEGCGVKGQLAHVSKNE